MRRLGLVFSGALLTVSAAAQGAATPLPANYRTVLDNASVTVMRVQYGPHESIGVHDHPDHPTVYVYLNDSGPVRFKHEDGGNFVLVRKPTHTGAFRVSPGRLERHSVENLSDKPSHFVRVELKNVPLRSFKDDFRADAPATLQPGTAEAYNNSVLRIERVVCEAAKPCVLPPAPEPSVLIAFNSMQIQTSHARDNISFVQPAAWLPAKEEAQAKGIDGPAYLLRIVLLKP